MSSVTLDSEVLNFIINSKGADKLKELAYLGVYLLQSEYDSLEEKINSISTSLEIEESKVLEIAQGIATLFWECSKASSKNSNLISEALTNANLSNELVETFSLVYKEHKRKFVELKNMLAISHRKYNNLTWRLDVELARRSMHVMTEPKYMIRLDIEETDAIVKDNDQLNSNMDADNQTKKIKSYHLQSDYANLKKVQLELQRAVNEMNSVHAQRLSRYIT